MTNGVETKIKVAANTNFVAGEQKQVGNGDSIPDNSDTISSTDYI